MKKLLKAAIRREQDFILSCSTGKQKDNPQVIKMRLISEGHLEALQAVLDAANGYKVYLRILAGE